MFYAKRPIQGQVNQPVDIWSSVTQNVHDVHVIRSDKKETNVTEALTFPDVLLTVT